jgi:hypothetical protein
MPERTRRRSAIFCLHTVFGHLSEGCDLSALARLPKGGSLGYYGELWLAALPGRFRLS